jgi:hypothetical protein
VYMFCMTWVERMGFLEKVTLNTCENTDIYRVFDAKKRTFETESSEEEADRQTFAKLQRKWLWKKKRSGNDTSNTRQMLFFSREGRGNL